MDAENHVKIISKVIIKPSSPTPNTHKTVKLSFLDQLLAPPFYVPFIFFYQPDNSTVSINHAQISQQLKNSLSEALTLFYPLAGKLNPQISTVDCNDGGAEFVEARVHTCLSDVIQEPNMDQLKKYLPMDPNTLITSGTDVAPPPPLLAAQINFFDCGGIAIGICSSHQITDGASLVAFVDSWAAACRRQGQKGNFTPPSFDLARYFPPRDMSGFGFPQLKKEKLVTKRFVFDKEKLAALKRTAVSCPPGSSAAVKDPTRVEVVSAFIWKHFTENGHTKNVPAAWHIVNLRPRVNPTMENVFGNFILKKFIFSSGADPEFHELVSEMRNGLREIDDEYIWKLSREYDGYASDISKFYDLVASGEMESVGFSSWARFPVYEMDYGWGKPVWVCPTSCPEKNVVFLMGTKDGDGIEAWVNMLESSAEILEIKFKLLGN
ncbi:hypothetical protein DH2020_030868 [Rehmannia glutinosa]|uniref:Uncharacterized protein n=1 Tax=Rehmannia glutinosa TaxID=99300 RepID=A0ABR0VMX6_REHGL